MSYVWVIEGEGGVMSLVGEHTAVRTNKISQLEHQKHSAMQIVNCVSCGKPYVDWPQVFRVFSTKEEALAIKLEVLDRYDLEADQLVLKELTDLPPPGQGDATAGKAEKKSGKKKR